MVQGGKLTFLSFWLGSWMLLYACPLERSITDPDERLSPERACEEMARVDWSTLGPTFHTLLMVRESFAFSTSVV